MDKRTQIINAALALFYTKGIHDVGINEVIKASSVAKKTLYHHFISKDDLICACLITRDKRFNQWLRAQFVDTHTVLDVATALFNGLSQWINNEIDELGDFNGCFFVNAAAEFPQQSHPVAKLCAEHKLAVEKIIYDAIVNTQSCAKKSSQATQLSQLLMTLKEGMICQARVTKQPQTLLLNQQFLMQLIGNKRQ